MNALPTPHCVGHADVFFGPPGETVAQRDVRERDAVAICLECPYVDPCAVGALGRAEVHGVWGGLTEDELRQAQDIGTPRLCSHCGRRFYARGNTRTCSASCRRARLAGANLEAAS